VLFLFGFAGESKPTLYFSFVVFLYIQIKG